MVSASDLQQESVKYDIATSMRIRQLQVTVSLANLMMQWVETGHFTKATVFVKRVDNSSYGF